MDSLNVSHSNAIKKGTVEISGNSSMVDETTFKESDITFMISVKVSDSLGLETYEMSISYLCEGLKSNDEP